MIKANQTFLKYFYVMRIKHFHDNLNIVLISGREFFSAKCFQFPLTFLE